MLFVRFLLTLKIFHIGVNITLFLLLSAHAVLMIFNKKQRYNITERTGRRLCVSFSNVHYVLFHCKEDILKQVSYKTYFASRSYYKSDITIKNNSQLMLFFCVMLLRQVEVGVTCLRCPNVAQNDPFAVLCMRYKAAKVSFFDIFILTALNAATHLPKARRLLWAECAALSPLLMTCDPAG